MVRHVEGTWLISVDDVWAYYQCPQAFINRIDAASGLAALAVPREQPLRRLMGDVLATHRARLIRDLSQRSTTIETITHPHRDGVGPDQLLEAWRTSSNNTMHAFRGDANVIIGPVFAEEADGHTEAPIIWVGGVDMAVKSPHFAPAIDQVEPGWELWEAKLGASQTGKTLMRLAALTEYLSKKGVVTTNRVRIVFANGPDSLRGIHAARDTWNETRQKLVRDLGDHLSRGVALVWPDDTIEACGRKTCGWCSDALRHHDDIFLLPGITASQRKQLHAAGFSTMKGFVEASKKEISERTPDISREKIERLHLQATLLTLATRHELVEPPWEVVNPGGLAALPDQSSEDLFVDFEADPTFREWSVADPYFPTPRSDHPRWWLGIDYLIGVSTWETTSAGDGFTGLWADNFTDEEVIFRAFLDRVEHMISVDPAAHVYHYAPYEMVALHRLARRYRYGAELIATWDNRGVFVDLYRVFTRSVVAGISDYSLKSVERLFTPPHTRQAITGGAESVQSIHELRAHREHGRVEEVARVREEILHYNRQDTLSTRQLALWLRERKNEA